MPTSHPRPALLETGAAPARGLPADTTLTPASPPVRRPFIRTATSGDLAAMAALHISELPIGLFPRLGARFVARWHRAFLDSAHAVALVAVHRDPDGGEDVVGFLAGSTDRKVFRRELLTLHRTSLIIRGVLALAARPRVLAWFLRTRLRPYLSGLRRSGPTRADTEPTRPATGEPTADLTAIAVGQAARRGGTGRRLTEIYLARCAAVGASWVELTTSASPSSAPARAFYSRTGWTELAHGDTRDGQPVARFGRVPGDRECA